MKRLMINNQGFTLLEMVIVIGIMGVLAAIVIPKFTQYLAVANTAKIQADLQTMDTAVILYESQNSTVLTEDTAGITALKQANLIMDVPQPPKGKCIINGVSADVPSEGYSLQTVDGEIRAVLGTGNTADKFKK